MDTRVFLAAGLAALILPGCGDDSGGTGPGPEPLPLPALVGTWRAIEIEIANRTDPAETIDLMALGAAATAKIESNRRVSFVGVFSGEMEADTGTLTISGNSLVIDGDGSQGSQTLSCFLDSGVMTVTYPSDTYDFDDDGVEEDASLTIVFEKSLDAFSIADLAGVWEATKWEFTSDAKPSETVDVVAELGASGTVTVGTNGRYRLELTDPHGSVETIAGNLRAVGEYLIAQDDGEAFPLAFSCTLSAHFMTLASPEAAWDFDEDGVEETASMTIRWERRELAGQVASTP